MKKALLRALSAGAITTALVAGSVVPPAAATLASGAEQPGDKVHTVTLITGDVVTLRQGTASGNRVTVTAANGSPANVRIIESNDDLFVYPVSALHYVAAGTLDKALFNVTQLVADGYDDAHMPALPLIMLYEDAASSRRKSAVPAGAAKIQPLTSIEGNALEENRAKAAQFWTAVTQTSTTDRSTGDVSFGAGIEEIWLDGKVTASLMQSTTQIGAPEVWSGDNTGQGVSVVVLDTGIDATHPDFAGQIDDAVSFVPGEDVTDRVGHGTHVASTIAGTGAGSSGAERGVAPGATLDIGKVLGNDGSGQTSWVLAGMEWAARDQEARIINMSLGAEPTDGTDPMSLAVNSLSAETGALFVIAAGNAGSPESIGSPGSATAALTVGAVDSVDDVAFFSSTGPRLGDGAIKPDITAPGVGIVAARSQFTAGDGLYQSMNGTSMATPHVAGAAALLLHVHPELTGPQLKDDLVSTSKATPAYSAFQAGGGRVDTVATTRATMLATGSVSVNRGASPENAVLTQPVTYTNLGDKAVQLNLEMRAANAPAGLFRLSAQTLTVPAHTSATVELATDRALATVAEAYSAEIRASAGDQVLTRTAVGIPPVTHRLILTIKDGKGRPAAGVAELLSPGAHVPDLIYVGPSGSAMVSLPEDVYSVMSFAEVEGVHGPNSLGIALLGNPEVKLDADVELVLDASRVKQIQSTVPQAADDFYQRLDYQRTFGGGLWRSFWDLGAVYDSMWTVPTSDTVTDGDFDLTARWRKEQAVLSVASATHEYSDLTRQTGTTQLPKGAWDLRLVSAGNGASADYAHLNVTGKAVVVRRNDEVGDVEQAAAAVAAGAKLLLVANNQPGLSEYNYGYVPAPIEVALVSTDEGELLFKQAAGKSATVEVVSQPRSDYAYDLVQTHHNRIPADLVRHETKTTLARIDENFGKLTVGATGGEFRFDWMSFSNWGIGWMNSRPLNPERTDWVSVGNGYTWGQEAYLTGRVFEVDNREQYRANSRSGENWFVGIQRPFVNNNYQAPWRDGNLMRVDVPGFGAGDHVGMAQGSEMEQSVSLWQGTELIAKRSSAFVSAAKLSPKQLPYRFETKTSQPAEINPLSTATTTVWDFVSAATDGGERVFLPMPQLNYIVDADANGAVKNGSTVVVEAALPQPAVGAGKLGKPTLEFSYNDGATWQKATLSPDDDGAWSVRLTAPAGSKFVSMRAGVEDSAGNSISQTIIRAFSVRSK